MKFGTNIHCPLRTKPTGFGDPLTLTLAPSAAQRFNLSDEISPHLHDDRLSTNIHVLRIHCNRNCIITPSSGLNFTAYFVFSTANTQNKDSEYGKPYSC